MITNFSKAVIRTTTYSYDSILRILTNPDGNWIDELLNDDYFLTSLSLASPQLLSESLRIHEHDPNSVEYKKLRQSILKYAKRMATRCTPFGLFSGVGVVPIHSTDENDVIELKTKEHHQQHFRLDMNFSVQLVSEIAKNPVIHNTAFYFPNTTIYPLGENYRLVTYTIFNKMRAYDLISVEKNDYLDGLLERAKSGAQKSDLISFLMAEEIEEEEAEEYLTELIESQILVSEIEPTTIGLEIEFQLIEKLKSIYTRCQVETDKQWLVKVLTYLETVIAQLNALNTVSLSNAKYDALIDYIIDELPFPIEHIDKKFLIQCNVSLETSLSSGISESQEQLVSKAIDVLHHFQSKKNDVSDTAMSKFKEAFQKRYEEKFVSLVEALDVETGVGYGNRQETGSIDHTPFLFDVAVKMEAQEFQDVKWNHQFHPFWLKKFLAAKEQRQFTVNITPKELKSFEKRPSNYSSTFAAKTSFFKNNGEDLLNFEYYGGSTASMWYGRFCNSNKDLFDFNQEILDYEALQNDDYVIAEINHLPESRLGNVIHRAQGRAYQINYSSSYNEELEHQININDLFIGIRQGELFLVSKRLKKIVRTYHSNAFNSALPSNLPIFQFLADLEKEYHTMGGSLNLSSFHMYMKFLPRIMFENIIFQRASWSFVKKDFDALFKVPENELIQAFDTFRKEWLLPEQFVIKSSDNELLIYAKNCDSIQILLTEVKRSSQIQLSEFLPASYDSIVKDTLGETYNNELLFNYKMEAPKQPIPFDIDNVLREDTQAVFPPGSEWIYYKIYLGIKTSDKLLYSLYGTLENMKNNSEIEKWFFIRYLDPKPHIRLRLRLTDLAYLGEVLSKMHHFFEGFQVHFPIERIVLDSYQRELDRYGYHVIPTFESIFYHDSKMNIALIEHSDVYGKSDLLWLPTLYSMFTLCQLFELDTDQKDHFVDWVSNAFRTEFNAFSETTKSLNKKYSDFKKEIFSVFIEEDSTEFYSFKAIVDHRNEQITPLILHILKEYPSPEKRMSFLNSLIHMSVNRQFRTSQRMYEFILYDFLKKIVKTLKYVKPKVKETVE